MRTVSSSTSSSYFALPVLFISSILSGLRRTCLRSAGVEKVATSLRGHLRRRILPMKPLTGPLALQLHLLQFTTRNGFQRITLTAPSPER